MKVAVCVTTKGRHYQMEAWIGDMLCQPLPSQVDELIVPIAFEISDAPTRMAAQRLKRLWLDSNINIGLLKRLDGSTPVVGWNLAYESAKLLNVDWFVLGADDIRWRDGWLEAALTIANETQAQVIGLNDGHTNIDEYAPHYMVHRDFIRDYMGGYFIPPGYKTWWFDREICQKAAQYGLYAPSWDSWADHRHPDWGTAALDETHQSTMGFRHDDRGFYEDRKAEGFPVDYQQVMI